MNREIKFRAWDVQTKRMYPVIDLDFTEHGELVGVGMFFGSHGDIGVYRELFESSVYVMQWTGFRDRNGREIYEGDIMSGEGNIFLNNLPKFAIVWDAELSRFAMDRDGIEYHRRVMKDEINAFQVVGNIYENPELLIERKDSVL